MLVVRAVLAAGLVVVGATLIVRVAGAGLRIEIVPGLVLGAAMIALGLHRLGLIRKVRRTS